MQKEFSLELGSHPKTAWQKDTGVKEIKYHTKLKNKTNKTKNLKTFQIKPGGLEDSNSRFLSTTETFQNPSFQGT